MCPVNAAEGGPETGVSIGVAAARLGVTPSTLRSWSTRYGIDPSRRTAGGHRRYSAADLEVLDHLQARILHGLARAASQMDLDGAEEIMVSALRERGVVRSWDEMMRPVFVAVGKRWADTGDGIEIEHVLTEAALGALRRRRAELPAPNTGPPVLLAAAPGDQQSLSLQALAVGLSERRQSARVMGAQVPLTALAEAARRIRPVSIFVSCVVTGAIDPDDLVAAVPRTRPPTPVVVGGGGWPQQMPAELLVASDFAHALDLLTRSPAGHRRFTFRRSGPITCASWATVFGRVVSQ